MVCEQAARRAGNVLLDWQGRFGVREKGPADLVTEADLASQQVIRERLLGEFPTHGFLGEEEDASIAPGGEGLRWIVDPLDGTTNYVHGVPHFAVSIALEQRGTLLVGAVYDPSADECFSAVAGEGAYLNGKRLAVSRTAVLSQALVAHSFAAQVRRGDPEIADFIEVLTACQGTRRMGSSALNLCYLAAGRFDAYWATTTKAWDIAAGALLVREAGGVIRAYSGGELNLEEPQLIAAATEALHAQLTRELMRGRPE